MPYHVYHPVKTSLPPLHRRVRSLLTGYAGTFNRRHKRVGRLFQNRSTSIVMLE